MKSAFDCFQEAAKCERMAKAASDPDVQRAFQDAALQWLAIGRMLQEMETDELDGTPLTH